MRRRSSTNLASPRRLSNRGSTLNSTSWNARCDVTVASARPLFGSSGLAFAHVLTLDSLDYDGHGPTHGVAHWRMRLRKLQQIIQISVARVLRLDIHLDADALVAGRDVADRQQA